MENSVAPGGHPPTVLEAALRDARWIVIVPLVLLPVFSWVWIVVMADDMYGPMTGASAWMMTAQWDFSHLLLLWAMWAVMMTGMMLPSASPTLLLYGIVVRRGPQRCPARQIYALAAGYLIVWTAFSLGATALQRVLALMLFVSPMMAITSPSVGGTLLLIAGVYQLTPIKYVCLRNCQSPFGFLMTRWRDGLSGAFGLGLEHGVHCVGCCWALMLLLFVGGVMNLMVIAVLTAFVALEKLAPFGIYGSRISGALLIMAGFWMIVR